MSNPLIEQGRGLEVEAVTAADRRVINQAFKNPLEIPPIFKGWMESYLEPLIKERVDRAVLAAQNDINAIGTPVAYVPALTATTTSPTLGTGNVVIGEYIQIGKFVWLRAVFVFGATGMAAGSGTYQISLPVTAVSSGPMSGYGTILDNSANLVRTVGIELASTTKMQMRVDNSGLGLVTAAAPFVWAANDQISLFATYQAA